MCIRDRGEGDSRSWPMFTSCCPGWVRFVKARYPEFVDSLSTSKSPQQMFGAIAKTYYAKVLGVEPERLFVVSVMPCTAKKAECALPSMVGEDGTPDVDAVSYTHLDVYKRQLLSLRARASMRLLPRVTMSTRASPSSRSISTRSAPPASIPRSSLSCVSTRRTRLFVSKMCIRDRHP